MLRLTITTLYSDDTLGIGTTVSGTSLPYRDCHWSLILAAYVSGTLS